LPIRWACTLVLSAASLVGCALGAYLSDAIGRRPSIIGASVVTIVFGYIYARGLRHRTVPDRDPPACQRHLQHTRTRRHRGLAVHRRQLDDFLQLPGVVWLMIGLVVVQIVVVWAWGVEPRNRGLEDVAAAKA
jgi:putative MFS transporter